MKEGRDTKSSFSVEIVIIFLLKHFVSFWSVDEMDRKIFLYIHQILPADPVNPGESIWLPDPPEAALTAAAVIPDAANKPKGWWAFREGNEEPGVIRGRFAIRNFSISASFSLFSFALRFWNQIFTWVSVKLSEDENSALSAMDKYCLLLNFLSKANNCWVVNGVLGFLLLLCLLRVHLMFGRRGPSPGSETSRQEETVTGQLSKTQTWGWNERQRLTWHLFFSSLLLLLLLDKKETTVKGEEVKSSQVKRSKEAN